ncbi:unnamed protein product [Urochloa decumbens]|uniref:Uncharacterized protein n=1 Tax=Urochloa decumbens TaxID=240449 RepID=A0ABC9B2F2_9POAL
MDAIPGLIDTAVKLFSLVQASYQQVEQVPQGVDSFRKELRSIEDAIRRNSVTAEQDGVRSWITELKDIKLRIEDCVEYYNLKVIPEHDDPGVFREAFRYVKIALGYQWKLAQDIEEIKKLVTDAKGRVDNYQLPQASPTTSTLQNNRPYHHPNEAEPQGLETPKAELVHLLARGGDGRSRQLRVVAISGLGGSGKTILAKAAYNQVHDEEEFECKAWVSASNDVNKLLADILDALKRPRPPPSTDLSMHLRELLQNKRYIIGIDDLQTRVLWDDILFACPDNSMSSRIILTTTNEQIARNCHKNCRVYRMQPLDKSSARNLLERKAFGDGCPNNLAEGLEKILDLSEYLPLAIVNMAHYMRSTEGWNNDKCLWACNNLHSLLVEKDNEAFVGMNQVFNRSYYSLDDNAMTCLLSLSTYPKDHAIKRKSLIRRWLAERLVASTDNRPEEDVANECFIALVDHNFILPMKIGSGGQVKAFRVHRMMLPFIIDKANSENFVTRIDIHEGKKVEPQTNIRRLYLSNSSIAPPRIRKKVDLSRVRSLTFSGKAQNTLMDFKGCRFLRVLDLENCINLEDKNLDTVCKSSKMLKYLSIRGNKGVRELPEKIVRLRCLETLDTRDTKVDTLSMEVISKLPQLTHVFGEFKITCKNYDSSSLMMFFSNKTSKLQTLSGFFIDKSPGLVERLPCMPKLSKIKILCWEAAPSDEVIKNLVDSLKACFERELSHPNLPLHSLMFNFRNKCDLDFLDSLQVPCPCLLRSLKLCGKVTRLPEFIVSDILRELYLSGTSLGGSTVLWKLQGLQKLECLKLVEEVPSNFGTEDFIWHGGWFVYLKRLCLDTPELPKIVIEEEAMQGLESIQLVCTKLGGFSGVKHLVRLEELILPSHVAGAEVDDLSQQLSMHPMRPKFFRTTDETDTGRATPPPPGPSGPVLSRTARIGRSHR